MSSTFSGAPPSRQGMAAIAVKESEALIVEDTVIVEIKSVERFDPIFEAQVLTYLRVTGKEIGLLMNFNSRLLRDGIKRYVLS
jgi:GxxExxY protein